ncbi:bifunctional proline dehydrogenase/L-glutamate gamma-semialdehyde dehydrogenase PutA [Altererythrobacter sp. Root672]|uniref:bifunctional proline dehydrogenase/L-glutamate gamma-semialdehyde dehydrogenase PutA n=1 Tax=Altererythrobacter sp. Root672 TaxID=1736584 RepID=UPI0006FE8A6E|nr:bifunctional proline dehydrogenase/L-glutamate gamma-semialdehyde dehydrogenase PutA [Altererythrobacter sp. Root672]KRA80553.1 integrase [Altererythrobacter sp. Root672]
MAIDRSALRTAYRLEEGACIEERLRQAAPASAVHAEAAKLAGRLIEGARGRKPGGLDAFLATYGLGTDEGIALMCLAEALLRVPDTETADALIHDKLSGIDWGERLGDSNSTFVNAATFSLMLTGEVLRGGSRQDEGFANALRRAVGRLGEPVIRQATLQAMRILGGQFVFGRTIDEALKRADSSPRPGETHSFDMLGEAAMTLADAERYRKSYQAAIARLAREASGDMRASPGISVKLSALYPKYDFLHADAAKAALLPVVHDLALAASRANIHFTIDAEEAERLELSLDLIEALVADDTLFANGWEGFGLALQAYQKRAVPMCDWVAALARRHNRRLMVRLVKGAYWDSEIKLSQVGGHTDYPVFTRKVATDVSYLACAAKLLAAEDVIYPAFATHNAYTVGAIKVLAAGRQLEFQRLHGMGEQVYEELAETEGERPTRVRVYAPVGGHKDLLAYLVRRLLENGANSSFVNRLADADVPIAELVADPVKELAALKPRRNPGIPLPAGIYPNRLNSAGIDLADPLVREPLLAKLGALQACDWAAVATVITSPSGASQREVRSPQDGTLIGQSLDATPADVTLMLARAEAAQPAWDALGGEARAARLIAASDLFETHSAEVISLCQREAGKSLTDSVLELREAVDFLRYYACEARMLFSAPQPLPGPTGEQNLLRLHGRGVFATISPWNFPLAIFIGQCAGALAAGNTVIAKPAEQTPLVAALAVKLCHDAGIPDDVLQLAPGDGRVGAALTSDPRIAGVAFTGSTETARIINRTLASRDAPIATLIAETGGQNALIVDSSALPEQVTRDVMSSAFQSAGQRCSALRVLYVQEDVADGMIEMIRGAFETLVIGDPAELATDVGPVIDAEAKASLDEHVTAMRASGRKVWQRELPAECENGTFVAPAIIEVSSIADLQKENFGPVLHVARFAAGELEQVVEAINATGYGLTLGLHSRIDSTRRLVESRARAGNFYVNRNQIGAVVGSQPFGGEGLSGTGPKAGGPNYVVRFATERVTTIDTTAAGGNASLLAGG